MEAVILPFAPAAGAGLAESARRERETVTIGGLPISRLSRAGLMLRMLADCSAARRGARARLIFAANGHALSHAASDAQFRSDMAEADIIHADGQPLVFASRFLSAEPIAERSATTDMIHDAAKLAAERGLGFYLLGATEAINAKAAEVLRQMYPGLIIAGRRHGYFGANDEDSIVADINASGADIVWIGMGLGREDSFCVRNRDRLKAGWLITCGGCFNFVAGDYVRAPQWMQDAGLEWLHRLIHEPRRLFRRYAVTNVHAAWLILTRTGLAEPA